MARKRFRILLVDDEPDVLELLKETFADDYDVLTAASGWTAIDLLRTQPVDLLITDQRMPQITGVQLAERAHVDHPHLPIIILTAYTDPPDLIAAINKGQVDRFITKPWDVPHLLQAVEDALESVRLRQENAQLLEAAQRRLDALKVMLEVLLAASATPSYTALIDTVASLIEGVIPLNVSATLLRPEPGRAAQLVVRLRTDVGDSALVSLKDEVIEHYRALTGEALHEDAVNVMVTGTRPRGTASATALRSVVYVPLRIGGVAQGVLCVAAHEEDAFSRDDATMLDLITNHAAELVAGLRTKLDAERARMASVVEGMADGLVLTDAQGDVVVVNARARELLQLKPAETPERARVVEALTFDPVDLARGLGRGGPRTVAIDVAVEGRSLRAIVSPLTDPRGRAGDIVTVLQDTTEERDRERRKEEFFADVSHELRTPLTAVAGALDLLLLKPEALNDSQRGYVTLARSAASRLHSTIDDILDISRAARVGLEIDVRDEDLRAVAREAVARFEPSFVLSGSTLTLIEPAEPVRARFDPARIAQVLNNLIGNALKFTPAGQRTLVEVFRNPGVSGTVGFSVSNDGPAIAPEDRERIFLPYQRAPSGVRRVKGTGLGLPLARTIVEAHGGRLWAEAEASGALFVAVLPADGPPPSALTADPHEPIGPEPRVRVAEPTSILVVDDDRPVGYAIKGVLLAAGFQVELAQSATDALTLARRVHPKAFVVDIRMPSVDGAQLIEILRHDPDTREAAIVALSSPDADARAKKAGADGFLAKPVDGTRLIAMLAHLTRARAGDARILVVTADAALAELCTSTLAPMNVAVEAAASAASGQELIATFRPDLTILDLTLADGGAFDLLEDLKSGGANRSVVVCLAPTADTRAKVRALQSGADDCVSCPVEPIELRARVENLMRRREDQSASGAGALPGSAAIDREVQARLHARAPFAFCYVDLDNFKAFNDTYGYARADGVVAQTGDLLRSVVEEHGQPADFVGHIAGDDFVFITSPERAALIAREVMSAFDRLVPLYYGREDRERGYIEADDRFGQRRRFPIMGISIVGVTDPGGRFKTHGDLSGVAAGLKKEAKAVVGSAFVFDDGTTKRTELPAR